jgi:hypothetical protein
MYNLLSPLARCIYQLEDLQFHGLLNSVLLVTTLYIPGTSNDLLNESPECSEWIYADVLPSGQSTGQAQRGSFSPLATDFICKLEYYV